MTLNSNNYNFSKNCLNHSEQQNMERGRRKDRFVSNRRKLQYKSYKMPVKRITQNNRQHNYFRNFLINHMHLKRLMLFFFSWISRIQPEFISLVTVCVEWKHYIVKIPSWTNTISFYQLKYTLNKRREIMFCIIWFRIVLHTF